MKESISTSYFFTVAIVIIGLCAGIVIGGLSFSKAFKIKNRIIELIEKNEGYDENTKEDIDMLLSQTGYPVIRDNRFACPKGRGEHVEGIDDSDAGVSAINVIDSYKYCVYRYKTVRGYYYSVVTYMEIEIPLVGDFAKIEIPIYGDSKVFIDL